MYYKINTMRIFFTTICLLTALSHTFAIDGGDQVKMVLAKQKIYAGQWIGALNIYKEVLQKNPTDGTVLYYVGKCQFELKKYEEAEETLKKAVSNDKDIKSESHLLLGKIYLAETKIDEALTEFNAFKTEASSKLATEEDVEVLISHCKNAKLLMANPINVKVDNMGPTINSKHADKTPCLSADGRKLVFTSRRPETTDSPMDTEGDGDYFEDIYISNWDTVNKKWIEAETVPGSVNTDAHDACTSISPDGKQIYIYKNDINDPESRGGDIFISKVVNNKWKTPDPMGKPINSSYWEGGACISADGKTLYFISERKGGLGKADIWISTRISRSEWSKPINMGADINSEFDEVGVFLAPDNKTLFFSSNGKNSMGSYDIFKTTLENGKWSKPSNLGYPINTPNSDGPLAISADAQFAYIASDRAGGLGLSDIYRVDLSNYGILEKDGKKKAKSDLSILKGIIRDGFEGTGIASVDVSIKNTTGIVVESTITNDNGEYFFTLKGGEKYLIVVSKKGYKVAEESIELKIGDKETYSLEKQFLLSKEK